MKFVVSPPPYTIPPRPSNPTPLEMAIYEFQKKALAYHHKKALLNGANKAPELQAKELAALEQDWRHLERERIRISVQAGLQQELDDYRTAGRLMTSAELRNEAHHPTAVLARNLTAVGEPKPSPDHDPHHIIMGKGRWRSDLMMRTRLTMHMHKIRINDPLNGVWLPRNKNDKGHWATPESPAHKDIHRYNYETWIVSKFVLAGRDEAKFRNTLLDVKTKLRFGGYPSNILAPKDVNWRGE